MKQNQPSQLLFLPWPTRTHTLSLGSLFFSRSLFYIDLFLFIAHGLERFFSSRTCQKDRGMRTRSVMWVMVRVCRCVCKSACGRGAIFIFCLYSSCVRAYVTQCALVAAVILRCSTSWRAFRSIRQSASFLSYCSSLLSVLALGFTVILIKGTPPRSAILITVVWPSRAVFAFIVFISLFRQDSCPSSLLLCLIVFLWCQCFVFVGDLLPNVWEKWDCDLSRRRCQWCKHRDKENLADEERSECGGDLFFCEALSTGFLSIGSRPVTLQLGTTFPQWAGAPQLQGPDEQRASWLTIESPQSHWHDVGRRDVLLQPFSVQASPSMSPPAGTCGRGQREKKQPTHHPRVDLCRRRSLAGKTAVGDEGLDAVPAGTMRWTVRKLADDSASEVSQLWTPSRPVVVVVVGRRSPPEAASLESCNGRGFFFSVGDVNGLFFLTCVCVCVSKKDER